MASGNTLIFDYNVITANDVPTLITAVKAQLATPGWTVRGDIVVLNQTTPLYAQTMVFIQSP